MFVLSLFAFFSICLQYFQEQQKMYLLFEKWQGRRKGIQGKTNASRKLLKPWYKSFQTYHGKRLTQVHSMSYLYRILFLCTCIRVSVPPACAISKDLCCKWMEAFTLNQSIHSRLRDPCEMGCYSNTDELLQLYSLSHHHLLC